MFDIFLETIKSDEYYYFDEINKNNFKQNQVYQITNNDDFEKYFYYSKVEFDKIWELSITFENMKGKLNMSDDLISKLEEKNQGTSLGLCGEFLMATIEKNPDDISFVMLGQYKKQISIDLMFEVVCPENNRFQISEILIETSTLFAFTLMSNIFTTLFISLFHYKDMFDTPQMIRSKEYNKMKEFISFLTPFDCTNGFQFTQDKASFDSYQKIKNIFIKSENLTYSKLSNETHDFYT
jgi:hypothetical protein